ncbi:hypothetical protein GO286_05223 [Ralstonia solanacearum]|nr:hypothetical protein [Ralstonia solanacearum]NKF92922.1 hypothetical protein [Ralstonia solanacearum]
MTVASGVPSPFRSRLTVLPASAVPESAVPLLGLSTGAAGAAVSTVRGNAELAALTLPAASVAVAVRLWPPSVNAVVGVKVQLPEASAVVVPSSVVPSKMLMVRLASAVPVSTGMASLVLPPAVMSPVTGATLSVTVLITGVAGVAVSTVRVNAELAALTLPAASVAVAVKL